jgi:4-hydroxybutyrate CoA-transferase
MKFLKDVNQLVGSLGNNPTFVLHSGCAEPRLLADFMARNAKVLCGARLLTLMPMGDSPYGNEIPASELRLETFFPGKGLRSALSAGRVQPLRYPLSAIPDLFNTRKITADVLLVQVSPPDNEGNVSLGISVDYVPAVLRQSPVIIAEINPLMPTTCGNTRFPASLIDFFVNATSGPQMMAPGVPDEIDKAIAVHVAGLVSDGAIIQTGIGSLPDCVLGHLGHLRHLGLHSGIVTDAIRPLIESGVIDNSTKTRFKGVSVTTMAGGTQEFYNFLHRNSAIEFHPLSVTHNPVTLAEISGLCTINSGLQIDLAGNVNAEQVGGRRIALPGGMPDFCAGGSKAPNGKSIVVIRSTFGDGNSNVLPRFNAATPVTVDASSVTHLVTEFGVAAITGLTPERRAASLIEIAHPAHRNSLRSANAS